MAEGKNINEEGNLVFKPENTNYQDDLNISEEGLKEEAHSNSASDKKRSFHKPKKDKKDEEIEKLNEELAEISDKHLRLLAEFDNYRRRTLKEKSELIKSGGESVLVSLLPVIDDFDRALDLMKDEDNNSPIKQGFLLIYNKFQDFLRQNNVKEVDAFNKEFDCEFHEAITKIPASSEELKGKNIDVIQKGYLLNEKVIRFAKVVVGE
jgi:molecular chaperone GrpE